VITDIKKNQKKTFIIVKSIHSSLRSESKIKKNTHHCKINTFIASLSILKLKQFEIENFKQLKTSQNILKILWCIDNANINFQLIFYVSTVICFRVTQDTEIDIVKN